VRSRTDLRVASATLVFCAAVYALTFRFDKMPEALMSGLGAEFFPRLILVAMSIFALLVALGVGNAPLAPPPRLPRMVWLTGAAMLLFMVLVEVLGMWLAAFLFLVGLGRLWGERSLIKLSVSALGLCAVLYLVFVRLLGGNFPLGLLEALRA
jgi:putative tricarboxylic transport membrane protein